MPPTMTTSLISPAVSPASDKACLRGAIVRSTRSAVNCSSLAARQGHHQVFWSTGIRCQIRQVDLGLHRSREFDLGFFGGFLQTLQGLTVCMQVDAIILLELLDEVIHEAQIKVIAAEEGITARRANLEDAVTHIQDGNIEGAAAQIINSNNFIFLFIKPIRQRGSCRLIDDTQHFQPGDLAGIFGRVALRIVEIRRER